jgi:hypothetical protein
MEGRTLMESIGTENTEENTGTKGEEKKGTRGVYFICEGPVLQFPNKSALVNHIEKNEISDDNVTIIRGSKKTIGRQQVAVVDIH